MREFFKGYVNNLLHPVVIALAFAVVLISSLTGCGSNDNTSVSAPTSLTGDWHQVANGIDGMYMTATVYPGQIQIWLRSRTDTEIYWMGSFSSEKSPLSSFKTVSLGDQDAMAFSLFGSGDETKTFQYKNGVISFKFSVDALHKTTTVKLAKNSVPTATATATKKATVNPYVKSPAKKTKTTAPKKTASVTQPKAPPTKKR